MGGMGLFDETSAVRLGVEEDVADGMGDAHESGAGREETCRVPGVDEDRSSSERKRNGPDGADCTGGMFSFSEGEEYFGHFLFDSST